MVFSSSIFLVYFLPVFLLVYFLADRNYKNYVALAGSLVFFAWGAPLFIFVVVAAVILDFLLALLINKLKGPARKGVLIFSVCLNVAVLLLFQYSGFFLSTLDFLSPGMIADRADWLKVWLPLGLSFITFHQISYLLDVYRETATPMKKPADYFLFILFFPQLVSGPITRVGEMAGQIAGRTSQLTVDNRLQGFIRFILGLSKKVLIADILALQVDRIFAMSPEGLTTPLAWLGVLAFAFRIYFDFSGYSDMAIGLARMMGFVFPENFNNPYISQSITEFWRRWHMTLSSWLRDYLFMPMSVGMRNSGKFGLVLSIMITFVLCGMWHQPGWTFIIWGAWHGLWLALDRLFLLKWLKKAGRLVSMVFTFFITTVGWVFFRSANTDQAFLFLKRMFVYSNPGTLWDFKADFWTVLGIAALFSFLVALKPGRRLEEVVFEKAFNLKRLFLFSGIAVVLFILCMGSITSSGFIPFIYTRF